MIFWPGERKGRNEIISLLRTVDAQFSSCEFPFSVDLLPYARELGEVLILAILLLCNFTRLIQVENLT